MQDFMVDSIHGGILETFKTIICFLLQLIAFKKWLQKLKKSAMKTAVFM